MVSSNYSYFIIIIYLHTVIWFSILSNTNNLLAFIWFHVSDDNDILETIMSSCNYFNTNDLHIVR